MLQRSVPLPELDSIVHECIGASLQPAQQVGVLLWYIHAGG